MIAQPARGEIDTLKALGDGIFGSGYLDCFLPSTNALGSFEVGRAPFLAGLQVTSLTPLIPSINKHPLKIVPIGDRSLDRLG
jgi:hypothetical protein